MANVLGSMVVQDLTYTQAHHGLAFKITYVTGGTAGSEVVTLNGVEVIVKMASGVSTASQILAAINSKPQALALVSVALTGVGSNAQTASTNTVVVGEATPSTKDYFANQALVALTTSYVAQRFGFHAESIIMYNDETGGTDYLEWSFNGTDTGGRLMPGQSVVLDHLGDGRAVISLRSNPAGVDYRLEVAGV